jgi:formylglycine-generating enzyme required for sulfatase activity
LKPALCAGSSVAITGRIELMAQIEKRPTPAALPELARLFPDRPVDDGTTPVDAYPAGATPEGVHDLAGNVWEWCRDWFASYPEQEQLDPAGPDNSASRVLRGGSYGDDPRSLRSANRGGVPPHEWSANLGSWVVWGAAPRQD